MTKALSIWWKNRDGATAIEYALIAAGISLAIVAAVFTFGDEIGELFLTLTGLLTGDA